MHSTRSVAFGPALSLKPGIYDRARRGLVETFFDHGFSYSKKLTAHTSCVNALAFSSRGGQWLASAGDDRDAYVWNLHQEEVTKPSCSFHGHRSNIFTVAFSASNKYLFSGGTDEMIFQYDFSRGTADSRSAPLSTYTQHSGDIRDISCHPTHDEIFLSASSDGSVRFHDGRAESSLSRAQATLQQTTEFSTAQFHPVMEDIFVTSDSRGNVCLRDVRMAFGPRRERSKEGVVQKYITTLIRKSDGRHAAPDASSVTFDSEGKKLAVAFLQYLPTIYSLTDPYPLATCSGRNLPDGNPTPPGARTYGNWTTIKHGSFGGPGIDGDGYYSFGSDDFRGYVWKIPPLTVLSDRRQTISADDWSTTDGPEVVAFTDVSSRREAKIVPLELPTPLFHLNGHKSIVNTTLIHPTYPLIMTSGIERHVFMHSPTPTAICSEQMALTPTDVRPLPDHTPEAGRRILRALTGGREDGDDPNDPLGEDGLSITFFDEILRQESLSEEDVFSSRGLAVPAEPGLDSDSSTESVSQEGDTDESMEAGW
ncbi:WD40 repeat-like protein [Artomyces pyxidatus]|uniref:WD40 repeat-like protein n=1 Tax=Artomyces pyxidatus TaxID=48021 RepID=A0ACB8SUT3_9AGAM|nr:WD40 repeat-like protein [Artomyces pyxidatus]